MRKEKGCEPLIHPNTSLFLLYGKKFESLWSDSLNCVFKILTQYPTHILRLINKENKQIF